MSVQPSPEGVRTYPGRWPAVMTRATAAAYLDVSVSQFEKFKIPSVQMIERGERMWLIEDLDAYRMDRRMKAVRV